MDLSPEAIQKILSRYKFRDVAIEELKKVHQIHPAMKPVTGTYSKPTTNMVIREGKHVDARGRIYLPSLHNWDHPKSSVVGLLAEMISQFEEEPPLGTKSTGDNRDPNELLAFVSNLKINE
ncbi:unnamed protein product, partial [Coregonus sp. 'balchen']